MPIPSTVEVPRARSVPRGDRI